MDPNVIQNVADYYARKYDLMDCLSNLKELIKNHGNKPFYIIRYTLLVKNYLICSKNGGYTAVIPSCSEHHLLEDFKKKNKIIHQSKEQKSSRRTAGKRIFK